VGVGPLTKLTRRRLALAAHGFVQMPQLLYDEVRDAFLLHAGLGRIPQEMLGKLVRRFERYLRGELGARFVTNNAGMREWWVPGRVRGAHHAVLEVDASLRAGAARAAFRAATDPDFVDALLAAKRLGGADAVRAMLGGRDLLEVAQAARNMANELEAQAVER
jgi:hypothetical protein